MAPSRIARIIEGVLHVNDLNAILKQGVQEKLVNSMEPWMFADVEYVLNNMTPLQLALVGYEYKQE